MEKKLPNDIENSLLLFKKAFNSSDDFELTKTFKDAIYVLNDSAEEFSQYRKTIEELKLSNTIRLLNNLNDSQPKPDYKVWLEYVLLICIDLKPEIKKLRTKDHSLFESTLKFLSIYKNEITPELKKNISDCFKEITG